MCFCDMFNSILFTQAPFDTPITDDSGNLLKDGDVIAELHTTEYQSVRRTTLLIDTIIVAPFVHRGIEDILHHHHLLLLHAAWRKASRC